MSYFHLHCKLKLTINTIKSNFGFWGEGKPQYPEKTSRCRGENQQTQPTYSMTPDLGIKPGPHNLVGGECSYHCAIAAPPVLKYLLCKSQVILLLWSLIIYWMESGHPKYTLNVRRIYSSFQCCYAKTITNISACWAKRKWQTHWLIMLFFITLFQIIILFFFRTTQPTPHLNG